MSSRSSCVVTEAQENRLWENCRVVWRRDDLKHSYSVWYRRDVQQTDKTYQKYSRSGYVLDMSRKKSIQKSLIWGVRRGWAHREFSLVWEKRACNRTRNYLVCTAHTDRAVRYSYRHLVPLHLPKLNLSYKYHKPLSSRRRVSSMSFFFVLFCF